MDVQPMEQGVSWAEAWAESARNPAAWRRGGGPMGRWASFASRFRRSCAGVRVAVTDCPA